MFIIGAMTALFNLDDATAEQMNDAILHMVGGGVDDHDTPYKASYCCASAPCYVSLVEQ